MPTTSTKLRPTLERKFIALASVIILSCSFVANIGIVNIYRNQLFSEAEKRAHLLAESTAISFTNALLYEELNLVEDGGLLETYINELLADPMTAMIGVAVYDTTGSVLASDNHWQLRTSVGSKTFEQWSDLIHAEIVNEGEGASFAVLFPLQIGSKHFGMLQMRFSRVGEIQRVDIFKQVMFMVSLGFAVFGVLFAVLVARTLAKPIKRLASEMSQVKAPDYVANFSALRRDEIGDLEHSFIDMLSRLKEAAEERERQQQGLIQTEKLASVGTLVSGLAHEINNPLAGIRNCLRRIKARPEDTSQTTKYARLMDDALGRIEKIVHDLLDFSRKKELLFKPANLNEIITAAFELAQLKLQKGKLSIELDLQKDLPDIPCDNQHLQQVFLNLLLNAADATEEAGKISVTTRSQDSHVIAEVRDTGSGVPTEIRDKIFDPFFSTKPVGQGTGLGLSVSKAIVNGHQGTITVESDARGTVFRISFPARKTLKAETIQDSQPDAIDG